MPDVPGCFRLSPLLLMSLLRLLPPALVTAASEVTQECARSTTFAEYQACLKPSLPAPPQLRESSLDWEAIFAPDSLDQRAHVPSHEVMQLPGGLQMVVVTNPKQVSRRARLVRGVPAVRSDAVSHTRSQVLGWLQR
jgi:hypothetical protein